MRIVLPYDPDWQALKWAKDHCSSYITNKAEVAESSKIGYIQYNVVYYFSNDQEALMFKLKWS